MLTLADCCWGVSSPASWDSLSTDSMASQMSLSAWQPSRGGSWWPVFPSTWRGQSDGCSIFWGGIVSSTRTLYWAQEVILSYYIPWPQTETFMLLEGGWMVVDCWAPPLEGTFSSCMIGSERNGLLSTFISVVVCGRVTGGSNWLRRKDASRTRPVSLPVAFILWCKRVGVMMTGGINSWQPPPTYTWT